MKSTLTKHAVILTLFAIGLLTLTRSPAFGQSADNPNAIRIEVASQSGSPVQLTAIGIRDNPYFEDVQMVEFTVQNISQKRIRVFVPLLSSASFTNGSTMGGRYDLEPGKLIQSSLQEETYKLKTNEKLTLSLDYVLFADGTSWGPDTQKQSEYLSGSDEGEKYAIGQIKSLLKEKNKEALFGLLKLEHSGMNVDYPPGMDKTKSNDWQSGFRTGYHFLVWQLLPVEEKQELETILYKLEKIEKQHKNR